MRNNVADFSCKFEYGKFEYPCPPKIYFVQYTELYYPLGGFQDFKFITYNLEEAKYKAQELISQGLSNHNLEIIELDLMLLDYDYVE